MTTETTVPESAPLMRRMGTSATGDAIVLVSPHRALELRDLLGRLETLLTVADETGTTDPEAALPAAPPPPASPEEPPRSAPPERGKGRAGSPSRPQKKKAPTKRKGAEPRVRSADLKTVFETADGPLTVREAAEALAELLGVECTKSIRTRVGICLCESKLFESQGKRTGIYALAAGAPKAPKPKAPQKWRGDLLTAPLQDLTEAQLLERATKEDESGNATAFLATRKEMMKRRAG